MGTVGYLSSRPKDETLGRWSGIGLFLGTIQRQYLSMQSCHLVSDLRIRDARARRFHACSGCAGWRDSTNQPAFIRKHQHGTKIIPVVEVDIGIIRGAKILVVPSSNTRLFPTEVSIDPQNILFPNIRRQFKEVHEEYDQVFNPRIESYNDVSGRLRPHISMGPVPPPTKPSTLVTADVRAPRQDGWVGGPPCSL